MLFRPIKKKDDLILVFSLENEKGQSATYNNPRHVDEINSDIVYLYDISDKSSCFPKHIVVKYLCEDWDMEDELKGSDMINQLVKEGYEELFSEKYFIFKKRDINIIGYEYVHGDELCAYLEKQEIWPPLKDHRIHFLRDVAEALSAIHSIGHVHNDVKPENIMITKKGAVLIDYGSITPSGHIVTTSTYTIQPPETVIGQCPSRPSMDIFGYGIVCTMLLSESMSRMNLVIEAFNKVTDDVESRDRYYVEMKDLLEKFLIKKPKLQFLLKCLHTQADKRPTAACIAYRLNKYLRNN